MPPDLSIRSFSADEPEWMDLPDAHPEILKRDLANLAAINRWFGGRAGTRRILRHWAQNGFPESVLDCASGAGDHPVEIARHAPSSTRIWGSDIHPVTLAIASENAGDKIKGWVRLDMRRLPFADHSCDAVLCQLALHHFSEEDAVQILRELRRVSRRDIFVTDLLRHPLAYVGAQLLGFFWLREPMTRHDALLSVRRAFSQTEFTGLAEQAGWSRPTYSRLPFFRQMLHLRKNP